MNFSIILSVSDEQVCLAARNAAASPEMLLAIRLEMVFVVSCCFWKILFQIFLRFWALATPHVNFFSCLFVFSSFFGITYIVILHSENYENFEIYENISVMLPSFLYVSVILNPISVTSGQRDWITEKDVNNSDRPSMKDFNSDFFRFWASATTLVIIHFRNASVISVCFCNTKLRFRNVRTERLNYRKGRKWQKRQKFLGRSLRSKL